MQRISTENVVRTRDLLEPGPIAELEAVPPSGTGNVGRLWKIWQNRLWLGQVARWALFVSTVLVFLIPNKFESVTRVLPSDSLPHTGGVLSSLAGLNGDASPGSSASSLIDFASEALGTRNNGALYVALLDSRTVHENLVRRFDLMKVYGVKSMQAARTTLEDRADIKEDRKSFVITIKVKDTDKQRARDLAQGYVEEANKLLAHVTTSSAGQQRMFLEQRLVQVKNDLEVAEKNFSQYASKNATLDVPEQTRAMVESGAVLEAQVIAAQSELEGLQQIYTSNNVRVRSAQARLAELKRRVQEMGGSANGAPASAPGANSDQLYPAIRQLPVLGVEWADLYRQVKIGETVFELLTTQYELAHMEEARETPVLNIVDAANVPEKKVFPPRLLLLLGFTLFAVSMGALWILAKERWRSISYDDPGKLLAQSVFQSVGERWSRAVSHLPRSRIKNLLSERLPPE
jgi:uncharacterized protein involved in exopolysaccharide biosynthesis